MLKIGVTGGIGSGKSLVCKIISSMGYPVYNADEEAKSLTNSHPTIVSSVKSLFGDDIYYNGELNRKKVASLVFNNTALLQKLNEIIHPVVEEDFRNWVNKNSHHQLVFQEAAILFESGAYKQLDKTIAVWANQEQRIERVCSRDGVSREEVLNRIANQIGEDELLSRSNFVIKNTELELLTPQIVKLIGKLLVLNN
jgi:dephospho-CoA kinase